VIYRYFLILCALSLVTDPPHPKNQTPRILNSGLICGQIFNRCCLLHPAPKRLHFGQGDILLIGHHQPHFFGEDFRVFHVSEQVFWRAFVVESQRREKVPTEVGANVMDAMTELTALFEDTLAIADP